MRTVLITGTSTGFGLVTAVELAKRGWRVFATMRNPEKRGALEAALGRAGAGVRERVTIGQLDVTDEASVRAAVALRQRPAAASTRSCNAGVATAGLRVARATAPRHGRFFGAG
jgi:NAD(P)-dependent dehydrogenase (short-subunit alcohol dehydrogenase family)